MEERTEWGVLNFKAANTTMTRLQQLVGLTLDLPLDLAPDHVAGVSGGGNRSRCQGRSRAESVLKAARATFENVPPGFVSKGAEPSHGAFRVMETLRRVAGGRTER
ncbi:MAG: hypothetical protein OXH92_16040 [Bryobacterales bacterium]|nr:hypothetical protein [Bryobacterales bacterium]